MTNHNLTFRWIIDPSDAGERLDVFLADQDDPPVTRSQVRKRLDSGEITVNGLSVKAGYSLREGDDLLWVFQPPRESSLTPQDIPLSFLYEDDGVAIVDKPAGMVVHPSPGHPDGTLVNALLFHFQRLSGVGDERRPGIVHRIDKDTSGALAVTKTNEAHLFLADQFRAHTIERRYHALVVGRTLPDSGTIESYHARSPNHRLRFTGKIPAKRHAITHYKVLERFPDNIQLIECRLETGRTHQIRMHFFEFDAPLLGDSLYGNRASQNNRYIERQALHAYTLGFDLPNGDHVSVTAPYPDDFANALSKLRDQL